MLIRAYISLGLYTKKLKYKKKKTCTSLYIGSHASTHQNMIIRCFKCLLKWKRQAAMIS